MGGVGNRLRRRKNGVGVRHDGPPIGLVFTLIGIMWGNDQFSKQSDFANSGIL
jgi:hypothetical protein